MRGVGSVDGPIDCDAFARDSKCEIVNYSRFLLSCVNVYLCIYVYVRICTYENMFIGAHAKYAFVVYTVSIKMRMN